MRVHTYTYTYTYTYTHTHLQMKQVDVEPERHTGNLLLNITFAVVATLGGPEALLGLCHWPDPLLPWTPQSLCFCSERQFYQHCQMTVLLVCGQ